jgi:hypothetical protein
MRAGFHARRTPRRKALIIPKHLAFVNERYQGASGRDREGSGLWPAEGTRSIPSLQPPDHTLSNGAGAQEQNLTEAVIGDACFQGRDDVPMALRKNSKNFVGSGRDGDRGQDKIELVPSPLSTVQGDMSRDKGTPCPRLENPPPVFARFRTGLIGLGTDALPRAHIAD